MPVKGGGSSCISGEETWLTNKEIGTGQIVVPVENEQTMHVYEMPGRPEESHLQSPTDPDMNLSTRPARASRTCEASWPHTDTERTGSSHYWLTHGPYEFAHPLRSIPIMRTWGR